MRNVTRVFLTLLLARSPSRRAPRRRCPGRGRRGRRARQHRRADRPGRGPGGRDRRQRAHRRRPRRRRRHRRRRHRRPERRCAHPWHRPRGRRRRRRPGDRCRRRPHRGRRRVAPPTRPRRRRPADGSWERWNPRAWSDASSIVGWLALWLAVSVSTLILGLLLWLLTPRAATAVDAAGRDIGSAIPWGILLLIGLPIIAVLAMVTLVGIPLGIGILLALGLIYGIGYTAGAWVFGRRVASRHSHRRLPGRLGDTPGHRADPDPRAVVAGRGRRRPRCDRGRRPPLPARRRRRRRAGGARTGPATSGTAVGPSHRSDAHASAEGGPLPGAAVARRFRRHGPRTGTFARPSPPSLPLHRSRGHPDRRSLLPGARGGAAGLRGQLRRAGRGRRRRVRHRRRRGGRRPGRRVGRRRAGPAVGPRHDRRLLLGGQGAARPPCSCAWSTRAGSGSTTRSPSVWPEFGAAGKGGATIRHALSHRAGVPAIREPLTDDDLFDWTA